MYDLEGNLIREFESSKEGARFLNCEGSSLCQSAIKNKQFRGYYFKYKIPLPPRRDKIEILEEWNIQLIQDLEERINELEDYYITSKIHQVMLNNNTINELKQSMDEPIEKKKGHGRPPIRVSQYNKDGQLLKTFNSIKEASEETKDPVDKIRQTLNGKLSLTPHNFYYQKVDETKTKTTRDKNENDDETAAEYLDFYIPRDKESRKKLLYNYVMTRWDDYFMMRLTKKQQLQHKTFITKLIKSL